MLLIIVVVVDGVIQYVTLRQRGRPALAGGEDLLGFWDLAKALAVGIALVYTAGRTESRAVGTLGALFLVVGIEDQIEIHGRLGKVIADLFRFDAWIPGIGRYGALNIGEAVAMALFGGVAFILIWTGPKPHYPGLQRARVILTVLLVAMFFFAVIIDLVTAAGRSLASFLIEELGERGVLSLAAVYCLSLVSIKDWEG
ncbi:MAG: hypothetical protein OEM81_13005 [Acidimicrobiia bacterium]|nr:hypothetical protein [Acidimicrobiia bacterium]